MVKGSGQTKGPRDEKGEEFEGFQVRKHIRVCTLGKALYFVSCSKLRLTQSL